MRASYVSCVIQKNGEAPFVSETEYAKSLGGISELHRDIGGDELVKAANSAGYGLKYEKAYPLPGGKEFLRLDFAGR